MTGAIFISNDLVLMYCNCKSKFYIFVIVKKTCFMELASLLQSFFLFLSVCLFFHSLLFSSVCADGEEHLCNSGMTGTYDGQVIEGKD